MLEKINYKSNFELFVNDEKIGDMNTLKRLIPEREFDTILNNIAKGEKEGQVCFDRLRTKNFTYKFDFQSEKDFNKLPMADRKAILKDCSDGMIIGSRNVDELTVEEKKNLIKVRNSREEER